MLFHQQIHAGFNDNHPHAVRLLLFYPLLSSRSLAYAFLFVCDFGFYILLLPMYYTFMLSVMIIIIPPFYFCFFAFLKPKTK
jgi:hypothetical protein